MADMSLYGDPTIAAMVKPPQSTMMDTLGNYAQIQNQLNQSRQFGQMFQARQAMGRLAQQSVDPTTGQMDYDKFSNLISSDPSTAWMASDTLQALQQRRYVQAQTQGQELNNQITRVQTIQKGMGELMNMGEGVSPKDVLRVGASIQNQFPDDPYMNEQVIRNVYSLLDGGATGKMLADRISGLAFRGQTSAEQFASANGVTPIDTRGGIVYAHMSPISHQFEILGSVPKTLTPEELAKTVPYTDPTTNKPMTTTLGDIINRQKAQGVPMTAPTPGVSGATGGYGSSVGPQSSVQPGPSAPMGKGKIADLNTTLSNIDDLQKNNNVNLAQIESKYGIPPGLLTGLLYTESRATNATGPTIPGTQNEHAQGYFQWRAPTAQTYGVNVGDFGSEAEGAAKYISHLLEANGGDLNKALQTYGGFANPADPALKKYVQNVQTGMTVVPGDTSQVPGTTALYARPQNQQQQEMPVTPGATPTPSGGTPADASGLHGFQSGPSEFQTTRMKDVADIGKNVDDTVMSLASMQANISELREAMKDYTPGGLSTVRTRLASVMQGLGFGDDVVDKVAGGNLGSAQEIGKLAVDNLMSRLKAALTGIGGSRINQMEFAAFQKANPDLDSDPRAVDKVFKFFTKMYNFNVAEQQHFNNWNASGKDMTQWPSAWTNSKEFHDAITAPTSLPGVNIGGQAPGGTPTTAKVKNWTFDKSGALVPQ